MFYEIELKSHVRVPPSAFKENVEEAVLKSLNERFTGYISLETGAIVAVSEVVEIGEGVIIPGDGAAFYETIFRVYAFKPEMHEILLGKITDITDFGDFIEIGPLDGMIHVSQTMDDYVSFSKAGVLTGKETKRTLKSGDICRARTIAISFKEINSPKIGLTMRQPSLGNINWIEDNLKKAEKVTTQTRGAKK
ncbi:DNA-directed RNA polymerase [Candidatus Woesearchaeota archaeon]|nr:DNA-directed RNA polymerase [Candidatus Woesearchaeota archaeon]